MAMSEFSWRRLGRQALGFVSMWAIFWGLGWFSPGLGCFVAFVISFSMRGADLATRPLREYKATQDAAFAAMREKVWIVAEARSREGLELAQALRTHRSEAMYAMGINLCQALVAQRRFSEAEAEARRVISLVPEPGTETEKGGLAVLSIVLADVLLTLSRTADAEEWAKRADATAPASNPTFSILRTLFQSELHRRKGEYRQAVACAAEWERLCEASPAFRPQSVNAALLRANYLSEAFRPDLGLAIADGLAETGFALSPKTNSLGCLLMKLDRLAEAERMFREELATKTKWVAPSDPRMAIPLINLTIVLARQGQAEEATAILRRAEAFEQELTGEEVSALFYGRGLTFASLGDLAAAERALRDSISRDEDWTRKGHPMTADGLSALAAVVGALGRADEAGELLERVAVMRREYADVA